MNPTRRAVVPARTALGLVLGAARGESRGAKESPLVESTQRGALVRATLGATFTLEAEASP
jgi:hypothetical protein